VISSPTLTPSVRDFEVVLVWLVSSVVDQDLVFASLSCWAVNQVRVFTTSICGLPLLPPLSPGRALAASPG